MVGTASVARPQRIEPSLGVKDRDERRPNRALLRLGRRADGSIPRMAETLEHSRAGDDPEFRRHDGVEGGGDKRARNNIV